MSQPQPSEQPDNETARALRMRTTRMEAFSDGVFAIAITLLVLDVTVDADTDDLLRSILLEWPSYLAYTASFLTVGAAWLTHSALTEYIDAVDAIFLRLNLLVLMAVSFLPFPTRLVADELGNPAQERVAVTFYGLVLLAVAVLTLVLWRYTLHARLVKEQRADEDLAGLARKLVTSPLLYVGAIAVGLLLPRLAVILYFGIALYDIVPFRALRRLLLARSPH